eukprot:GHVO01037342.1.p1 GENE.GHVO01037342.1~~GHVO01037342.1.p1  ORF type:complete len:105 (-),score=2.22 GHVO01037342.1:189-503(-)
MPNYKLMYFDAKGLGEPVRWMFVLAEQPYEDYRLKEGEWPSVKPSRLEYEITNLAMHINIIIQTLHVVKYPSCSLMVKRSLKQKPSYDTLLNNSVSTKRTPNFD